MAKYQPKDIHGRLIGVGNWLRGNTTAAYARVTELLDEEDVGDNSAGFRAAFCLPGESIGEARGCSMGKHVQWEVIALDGIRAPTEVLRDKEGKPVIAKEVILPVGARLKWACRELHFAACAHGRAFMTYEGVRVDAKCTDSLLDIWERCHHIRANRKVTGSPSGRATEQTPPTQSFAALATDVCLNEILCPVTLRLVQETTGQALDDLARELGTTRIDEDSDEELQEQLGRILYKQGPEQVLDFLSALTESFRKEYYPDIDRELREAKEGKRPFPERDGVTLYCSQ